MRSRKYEHTFCDCASRPRASCASPHPACSRRTAAACTPGSRRPSSPPSGTCSAASPPARCRPRSPARCSPGRRARSRGRAPGSSPPTARRSAGAPAPRPAKRSRSPRRRGDWTCRGSPGPSPPAGVAPAAAKARGRRGSWTAKTPFGERELQRLATAAFVLFAG